ncbi:MAG: hypothetical protein ACYDCK_09150 [Thermoplasmatota archaeon]
MRRAVLLLFAVALAAPSASAFAGGGATVALKFPSDAPPTFFAIGALTLDGTFAQGLLLEGADEARLGPISTLDVATEHGRGNFSNESYTGATIVVHVGGLFALFPNATMKGRVTAGYGVLLGLPGDGASGGNSSGKNDSSRRGPPSILLASTRAEGDFAASGPNATFFPFNATVSLVDARGAPLRGWDHRAINTGARPSDQGSGGNATNRTTFDLLGPFVMHWRGAVLAGNPGDASPDLLINVRHSGMSQFGALLATLSGATKDIGGSGKNGNGNGGGNGNRQQCGSDCGGSCGSNCNNGCAANCGPAPCTQNCGPGPSCTQNCSQPCNQNCGQPCSSNCSNHCAQNCSQPCNQNCGQPCSSNCSNNWTQNSSQPCNENCSHPCNGNCSNSCTQNCGPAPGCTQNCGAASGCTQNCSQGCGSQCGGSCDPKCGGNGGCGSSCGNQSGGGNHGGGNNGGAGGDGSGSLDGLRALEPLSGILDGAVLILRDTGSSGGPSQGPSRLASMITLYRAGDLTLGWRGGAFVVEGQAALAFENASFGDAALLKGALPIVAALVWLVAIGMLVVFFMKRTAKEKLPRNTRLALVAGHLAVLLVALFLWDLEFRASFGISAITAFASQHDGTTRSVAGALAGTEIALWSVAWLAFGLPVRIATGSALRTWLPKRGWKGAAKGAGIVAALALGSLFTFVVLDAAVAFALRHVPTPGG